MAQLAYKTIAGGASGEHEDRKSRFIAHVEHVETEDEALAFIGALRSKHPEARHHVYAYVLRAGNRVRYSDDGEPQKTAGLPTLSVIEHLGLVDVACVTVRYFGGTLLGTGGLVRAYTKAPQEAFSRARVVSFALCRDLLVDVGYGRYDQLAHMLAQRGVQVVDTQFTDSVTLTLRALSGDAAALADAVRDLTQGTAELVVGDERLREIDV